MNTQQYTNNTYTFIIIRTIKTTSEFRNVSMTSRKWRGWLGVVETRLLTVSRHELETVTAAQ